LEKETNLGVGWARELVVSGAQTTRQQINPKSFSRLQLFLKLFNWPIVQFMAPLMLLLALRFHDFTEFQGVMIHSISGVMILVM
jgi:hypothetical protein